MDKGGGGSVDVDKREGGQTALVGVLCICLLRHLSDYFDSSWGDVRRTEYSASVPAVLAQASIIPVLFWLAPAGSSDDRGQRGHRVEVTVDSG